VSTSISLDYDSNEHIKKRKINLSVWVNNKIKKEFENKETIIKKLKKEIEEREIQIKEFQEDLRAEKDKNKEKMEKLSKEQLAEIEESIKILKERGEGFFEGRYRKYKNLFDNNLTKKEFEELLKICNI